MTADELTPTQVQLLQHLAAGHTIAAAARLMHYSTSGLKTIAGRMYLRYGVAGRTELVALARERGIVEAGQAAPNAGSTS